MKNLLNLPSSADIKKILRHGSRKLPSFPLAAAKLIEISKEDKASLADFAKIVETDPGISLRVLEIVNSAMYGLKRKITVLSEAVVFVGLDEIKKLADEQNNEVAKYARYRMLGASHMCLGELGSAQRELKLLVDGYVPQQHEKLKSVYGIDLRIAGRCFLSEVQWLTGDIEAAQASASQALLEARAMHHLHSHAFSLHFCALLAFLNRDRELVLQHTGDLMELASENAIGAWPTLGKAMQAWAKLNEDNSEEMLNALKDGVSAAQNLGVAMFIPFFYCRIAEEMLASGQWKIAAQYIQNTEDLISRTAEIVFKGEILQLKAQLRLHDNDAAKALILFQEGLNQANAIGAHSVALRVANSYAGYLLEQGNIPEAEATLLPVIGQFKGSLHNSDIDHGRELLSQIQAALLTHSTAGDPVDISGA